jgi:hypothetical protein
LTGRADCPAADCSPAKTWITIIGDGRSALDLAQPGDYGLMVLDTLAPVLRAEGVPSLPS